MPIRIVQCGLGPIGIKITQLLQEKPGFDIVGAVDTDPDKIGRNLGVLAELPNKAEIIIQQDLQATLHRSKPDIVILTTSSSLIRIKPQILAIVSCGVNVVSTCEELSYPWITNPEISQEIDRAAKAHDVSVLSTGVNPGFLMDFLPLAMSGICRKVNKVTVERFQNALLRRLPFQQKIGAGLTVDAFHQRVKQGTLKHVGLAESMHMIASRFGWCLEKTEDQIEPVIANHQALLSHSIIPKGHVLGVSQTGRGWVNGEEKILMIFKAWVGEPNPRDRIVIEGDPPIDSTIKNGINGDVATCAIAINAIPAVINAKPGLRTMADIEPVAYLESR